MAIFQLEYSHFRLMVLSLYISMFLKKPNSLR